MPLIKIETTKELERGFQIQLMHEVMNCIQEVLGLPEEDRNIRLVEHDADLFFMKRPYRYIVEICMIAGRSVDTKRKLFTEIVARVNNKLKIPKEQIFIFLNEQPRENWGIRGGIAGCDVEFAHKIEI